MSEMKSGPRPEYTRYTPRQRATILVGVSLATLLVTIDSTIVNVAVPTMMGNLGVTMDQVSWVSIGYMLSNVIFLPMTGWLEARFGRRKLLTASTILFTATSLLCGTSGTLGLLIFYRVLQGMGGAALMSTGMATLLDTYPPEKAGIVSAVFGTLAMVGPAIGPLLGGYLVDTYSWPWIFYVNVLPGIMAAVLLWQAMKEPQVPGDTEKPVDVQGIVWLSVWLGCLQVMLEKGERQGWMDSDFIRWLAVFSVVGMALFLYRALTTRHPIVDLRVLKHRALAAGCICSFVQGVGLFSTLFVLPVFLQQLRGYTAQQSGAIMLTWALASTACMMLCGVLSNRVPARLLLGIGALSCTAAMAAMRTVTLLSGPEHIFWPQVALGAGIGLMMVPLMTMSMAGLTGNDLGSGSGIFNMTRQLGGTIGISLVSTILAKRMHFHNTMLAEHVSIYDPETLSRLSSYHQFFMGKGSTFDGARAKALAALNQTILGQSVIMSYEDLFLLIAGAFILILPFVFLLRGPKPGDAKVQASMH